MFRNTMPHKDKLYGYQYSLRTGIQIPEGAVNLAHYNVKPLHPAENIVISDTSKFVLENINQEYFNQLFMTPDELGFLEVNGKSEIDSEFFDITNKFKDGVPLYYKYRLYYKHYDSDGPNSFGLYLGNSIKLVDINNRPLDRKRFKYDIYLTQTAEQGIYNVDIYTAFLLEKGNIYYCMYNAVTEKNGIHDIIPQYTERINPQAFFEKGVDYTVSSSTIGNIDYSKIKVDVTAIPDNRRLINCSFTVSTDDGSFLSNQIDIRVTNKKYALPHEMTLFKGNNMCISHDYLGTPMTAKDLVRMANPTANLDDKLYIVNILVGAEMLNITVDPDGNSPVYAETTEDTGTATAEGYTGILHLPDKYTISPVGYVPTYAVKLKDHKQIKLVTPMESGVFDNWYLRVQYGRFKKTTAASDSVTTLHYYLPEYQHQEYSSVYGKPYVDIKEETPILLNRNTIKLKFAPLYVKQLSDRSVMNMSIKKINAMDYSVEELTISSWNCVDGTVEVVETLNENDVIYVDYTYEEHTYVYRGCIDSDFNAFLNLDLNINQYHSFMYKDSGMITESPTYLLMNKTIYVYMKPVIKIITTQSGAEQVVYENSSVLYHTFIEEPESADDILLGKIYLRHNTTSKNVSITDTRTRGGGVLADMQDSLRRELEPESDFYWDIGYFDGTPYSENAVIIIRVDSRILKEYGGRFTPQEVEAAVDKWKAFGVLAIIEYVSTYSQDSVPNATMQIESTVINKLDFIPVVAAETYNPVKVGEFKSYYYNTNFKPYGIINVLDKELIEPILWKSEDVSMHPYLDQIEIDKYEYGDTTPPTFLVSVEDI